MANLSTLRQQVRWLREQGCCDLRDDSAVRDAVLEWQRCNEALAPHDLDIRCDCDACSCAEPATERCEGTVVCGACAIYVVDDDGEVLCSNCEGTEIVYDGPRGDHIYLRAAPPQMPEEDPSGEYALYWDTADTTESRVVARFTSREDAEQAVLAQDWPGPTDHTQYLCGYQVRQWDADADRWVEIE
jgi:hypothetical protein